MWLLSLAGVKEVNVDKGHVKQLCVQANNIRSCLSLPFMRLFGLSNRQNPPEIFGLCLFKASVYFTHEALQQK